MSRGGDALEEGFRRLDVLTGSADEAEDACLELKVPGTGRTETEMFLYLRVLVLRQLAVEKRVEALDRCLAINHCRLIP
jgi:hypothetical protein